MRLYLVDMVIRDANAQWALPSQPTVSAEEMRIEKSAID